MSPTKKSQAEDTPTPPSAPAPTPTPTPTTGSKFFGWMRSLGVQREFGWIGGVAAGIAVRIGVDVVVVRGILVVLAILGSPLLLVYAAAWLLLPDSSGRILLEQAIKGTVEPAIAGIVVVALLGVLPIAPSNWIGGLWSDGIWPSDGWLVFVRVAWTLVIVVAIVFLVIWIARSTSQPARTVTPAPPPPPAGAPESDFVAWRSQYVAWQAEKDALRQNDASAKAADDPLKHERATVEPPERFARSVEKYRASRPSALFSILVIGLSLVIGGIAALVVGGRNFDVTSIGAGLAVALGVLALGIIVNGARGKRAGGASGVALLVLLPLILFSFIPEQPNISVAGGATFEPRDVAGDLPQFYFAGAGNVVIDLRDYYREWVVTRDQKDEIYVFVAMGDVDVLMPFYDARVTMDIGAGDATFLASDGSERSIDNGEYLRDYESYQSEIQLHIVLGSGNVTIEQERFE